MIATTTEIAEDIELEKFLSVLSGLPPGKMAIWNSIDYRKNKAPFFPDSSIDHKGKIVFVINGQQMMAAFHAVGENKFYLRFYWLAVECPGYMSPGLPYEEAAALMKEFIESKLIVNNARAAALNLKMIVGQSATYFEHNQIHRQVMQKVFNVPDFEWHLEKLG